MKYKITILILLTILMSCSILGLNQDLPIQFQLRYSTGDNVAGIVSVEFNIYDVATGGTSLYNLTQDITFTEGVGNIILPNVNLDYDVNYWISLNPNSTGELSPRINYTSSTYDLNKAQYTIATQSATTTRDGYLTQTDWDTFNEKITLTDEASLYGVLSDVTNFLQIIDLNTFFKLNTMVADADLINKTYADSVYYDNTDTQDLSYNTATDVISLVDGGSIDITEVDTNTQLSDNDILTLGYNHTSDIQTWVNENSIVPAGNDGEIQFNNLGSFGSTSGLSWTNSTSRLGVTGDILFSGKIGNDFTNNYLEYGVYDSTYYSDGNLVFDYNQNGLGGRAFRIKTNGVQVLTGSAGGISTIGGLKLNGIGSSVYSLGMGSGWGNKLALREAGTGLFSGIGTGAIDGTWQVVIWPTTASGVAPDGTNYIARFKTGEAGIAGNLVVDNNLQADGNINVTPGNDICIENGNCLSENLNSTELDATYLRLDTTNDPLTGNLNIGNNNVTADMFFGDVKIDTINGQTYQTLQDWIDITQSAGKVSGGTFTSNADGTVNISSGNGFIKVSNDPLANTILFDWDTNNNMILVDNDTNYIYIDYNSGTPILASSLTKVNNRDKILLGKIFRGGNVTYLYEAGMYIAEATKNTLGRFTSVDGEFTRANGLILSEVGNLRLFNHFNTDFCIKLPSLSCFSTFF